jgi:DnaK suppressor protein
MAFTHEEQAALLAGLRARARRLRGEVAGKLVEAAEDAQDGRGGHDSGEQSFALAESGLDLAEASRDLHELQAIDRAMLAIDAGTYGSCERCGDPIEPPRLLAQPLALRCLDCQARLEREQGGHMHRL